MAKCGKCGKEYPDGTEHVCSPQEEQKAPETKEEKKEEESKESSSEQQN